MPTLIFFTKVATNRVTQVVQKVISPSQTVFLLGRNIMEGVIVLYKTIHEMHRNKQNGIIFKIDLEKVYDKINWSFVQQTLRMKGFSPTWCKWVAIIPRSEKEGMKPPYVCPGCSNHTHGNNMINRCNVIK
jgi:hypothetical protein